MFASEYLTVTSASMVFPLCAHYFVQLRSCLRPLQYPEKEI